jgi:hypothetical protein
MREKEIIYISGPMTGLPEFNFPLFCQVAKKIVARGHIVVNPATLIEGSKDRSHYLRADLLLLVGQATAIVVLPGWGGSRGARLEVEIGRQLGLPIYDVLDSELSLGMELVG